MNLDIAERLTGNVKPRISKPVVTPKIQSYTTVFRDHIHQLQSLLDSDIKDEVEVRLGRYNDTKNFIPGVYPYMFNRLKKRLAGYLIENKVYTTYSLDNSAGEYKNYRKISNSGIQKKIKDTKNRVEVYNWGLRVERSKEIAVEDLSVSNFDKLWNSGKKFSRLIDRTSYALPSFGVRVDLSIIDGKEYEVEIERVDRISIKQLNSAVEYILMLSQNAFVFSQVMSVSDKDAFAEKHSQLFRSKSSDLNMWYMNNPVNLKVFNMLQEEFDPLVTLKLDGVRKFLWVDSSGTYMYSGPDDVVRINGPDSSVSRSYTILDGEFMENNDCHGNLLNASFNAFDILYSSHSKPGNVRNLQMSERLGKIPKNVGISKEIQGKFNYKVKKYYTPNDGSFYERIRKAFLEADGYPKDSVDGLILQSQGVYRNKDTYKWKPAEQLTIDFKVGDSNGGITLWYGINNGINKFLGTDDKSYPSESPVISNKWKLEDLVGKIVEFKYDSSSGYFIPIRIRDDKQEPNFETTVFSIWKDIINPLERSTLEGDDTVLMRKYHNKFKDTLLSKYLSANDKIIDIGSGRGGDINKWDKIKLNRVYAIEPDTVTVKELERRLNDYNKSGSKNVDVKVLNYGAEEWERITKELDLNEDRLDISAVVSFFSLTFFGNNTGIMDGLKQTLLQTGHDGSLLIGSVLDGERVKDLLDSERKRLGIHKNKQSFYVSRAWSITQDTEIESPNPENREANYGNMVVTRNYDTTSMVKDLTEPLFYFDEFVRVIGDEYQLEATGFIDESVNFKGYNHNKLPEASQLFSRLNRWFIFRKKHTFDPKSPEFSPEYRPVSPDWPPPYSLYYTTGATFELEVKQKNEYMLYKYMIMPEQYSYLISYLTAFETHEKELPGENEVKALLKSMAKDLTMDIFKSLKKEKSKKSNYGDVYKNTEGKTGEDKLKNFKKILKTGNVEESILGEIIYKLKGHIIRVYILHGENELSLCKNYYESSKGRHFKMITNDTKQFRPLKRLGKIDK